MKEVSRYMNFLIPSTGLSNYLVLDSENQVIETYSADAEAAIGKLHINQKPLFCGGQRSGPNGATFSYVSKVCYKAGRFHFIELVFHDNNPEWYEGFFFLSFDDKTNQVLNGFYERVKHDANGNFRLHILYDPRKIDVKSVNVTVYHIIHNHDDLTQGMKQIQDNSEKIEGIIKQFKNIPEIDIAPPSSLDKIIIVPLECSYSKRFFSKLFLLQHHIICSQIISKYGLQQLQIPIKVNNEELFLLIYGDDYCNRLFLDNQDYFNVIKLPDGIIGVSSISQEKEYFENHCNLLRLIGETYQILHETGFGILTCSEVALDYDKAKAKVKEWIAANLQAAYKEYVDKTSEVVKWKNEFRLFQFFKLFFSDAIYQFRAEWLGWQSLDIYIPSLSAAIEYQGAQHYKASEFFGGVQGLVENQERDKQKRAKCQAMNIQLFEWNYKTTVTLDNIVRFINSTFPQVKTDEVTISQNLLNNTPLSISEFLLENCRFHEKTDSDVQHKQLGSVIRQYDENGNLLGEYTSIMQAANNTNTGISSIQKCLAGERNRAGGFFWTREEYGSSPAGIEKTTNKSESISLQKNLGLSKPVIQIDPATGEVIEIHNSISAAAKKVGIDKKCISDVLRHKQKTTGGFSWQYADMEE